MKIIRPTKNICPQLNAPYLSVFSPNAINADQKNSKYGQFSHSVLSRYQGNLETLMRGSEFIFDSIQLMYYKCHKVNFILGVLYTDPPDWIKTKKVTINL